MHADERGAQIIGRTENGICPRFLFWTAANYDGTEVDGWSMMTAVFKLTSNDISRN